MSHDSSLKSLGLHADTILLDVDPNIKIMKTYDTVYIRSHFSKFDTLPQRFRSETKNLVQQIYELNSNVKFIDSTDTVDDILQFEDKWNQYQILSEFMPKTILYNDSYDVANFTQPVYKNRLSSRGTGVTWDVKQITNPEKDWIVQESISIIEELRIYAICGEIYPIGSIRQNKTSQQGTKVIDSRLLAQNEIDFSLRVMSHISHVDFAGLDVVRTENSALTLIEVNRSPGFAKFNDQTGVELADVLYEKLNK